VKYVKCVKIWQFDGLVQFLKPSIQFLMNTIMNLAIVRFLMKKRRHALSTHVSHLTKRETCVTYTHLSYEAKGDMCYEGVSPF
jgi:hypothetical protein